MFLRKENKIVKTGLNYLVPFCKDCSSQDIETIQTCKHCGSHNIEVDFNDERSSKPETKEVTYHYYKCDKCGKEFKMLNSDKFIHYDGEFYPYKGNDEDFSEVTNYNLEQDLCEKCKKRLVNKLNEEINRVVNKTHIQETLENISVRD